MQAKTKILIVEDDNAMAQMCAKLIRRHGYSTVIARSSADALAIVRSVRDVDVVLSDLHMPKMHGLELLERLRRIDSLLPVIVMTGYGTLSTAIEAVGLGATDYIMKPFNQEDLLASIERALKGRHTQKPSVVSDIPA